MSVASSSVSEKLMRLKYLNTLKKARVSSESFLNPPDTYLIDANLFMIQPSIDNDQGGPKKAKSWVTILSVWNTMIGSNIVSIPFATYKAGVIPSIILNLIYFLVCYYTAATICKTGVEDNDFSDTIEKYLGKTFGKFGKYLQVVFSILLNVGATYIYFLIINQNLFPILAFILKSCGLNIDGSDMKPNLDKFSIFYCAIFLSVLMFPILCKKDITLLVKISSKGVYFVSFIILFVYYTGIKSAFNTTFDYSYIYNNGISPSHISLFGDDPSKLAGALSLGYYTHNIIIPIMKNNEVQSNNKRDLFLGYFLVFLTYTSLGLAGYYGFSGSDFYDNYKLNKGDFKDNWFKFFLPDNIIMLVFRLLSVFQLCSVFPIIVYVTRIQLYGTFWKNNYPSFLHIIVFNLFMIGSSILVIYFFYNDLGRLMGYIGAGTGFVLIYLTPLTINSIYFFVKHPEDLDNLNLKLGDDEIMSQNITCSGINSNTKFNESLREKIGISKKPYSLIRNIFFVIMTVLLMLFGLFTLIIQFVYINYFDIDYKKA